MPSTQSSEAFRKRCTTVARATTPATRTWTSVARVGGSLIGLPGPPTQQEATAPRVARRGRAFAELASRDLLPGRPPPPG